MERVQFALQKQLKEAYDLAALRLSEQTEELARQKRNREDVGVQLYQVQQQLAKMQMNLEKVHENHLIIAQLREQADSDLSAIKPTYADKLREIKDQRGKHIRYQSELDQLNMTLRQVEAYNEQMKSEIAVTRRATYKAEESISSLESGKRHQDMLVDSLNEKLKRAQEELALHEAQLISQRGETTAAAATLKKASTEMEAIHFERKQLLQQWKSALVGMQRRDAALQATEQALLKQREHEMALEAEVIGVNKAIKKEEDRNETLISTESKLEAEQRGVDANIQACAEKQERHHERFAMLNRSLEQTDAELTKIAQTEGALGHEVNALEAQVQKTLMEAKTIEDTTFATLGEQMATEKGTQNTMQATERLKAQREDKEQQQAQMSNELARIHVDSLNTRSHISELEQQNAALTAELSEKDSLVARYELEAKRRAVEIEKKQHDLDLLNKKFDVLMKQRAGVAELDEDAGPLEATIVHLKKEIRQKTIECSELQRAWITQQTDLVTVQNTNQSIGEKCHEHRAKLSILAQKQTRVGAQFERAEKELKELERGTVGMHHDLFKINGLLAEHAGRQQALADDNFIMEHDFVTRLKELETEAVGMEQQIVALKEQKEGLLLDVVEAEKQHMLIEKKIALERETQAALDPEVGAAEVRAMEREIHRMRLRYAQLQRRQEQMIGEMERAIYKRDNIEAKGKVLSGKKDAPPTQAVLTKQVAEVSKKLQLTTHDANLTQLNVLKLQESQAAKGGEVEAKADELRKLGDDVMAAEASLSAKQQVERVRDMQQRTQAKLAQRLQSAAQGGPPAVLPPGTLKIRIAEAEDTLAKLLRVVEDVSQEYPQHAQLLSTVVQALGGP